MKDACRVLLVLLILDASAAVEAQFSCTTNLDNTLTITRYAGPPWAVVIPTNINGRTVTRIGENAFAEPWNNGMGPWNLISVTIPGSVIDIGSNAFGLCEHLSSLRICNGVVNIGKQAFYSCLDLASVTIPGSVTNIGDQAFAFCWNLTNVMIPDSVTSIGYQVLYNCSSLASVTIPNRVTSIGIQAFQWTSLTSVTIPGSVTNIGGYAFGWCGLNSVYFAGNAPRADATAFGGDNVTVYYLPGTSGWSSPFAGFEAVLWNPLIQSSGASFGVRNNQFGFSITGTNNFTVVVEVCTNLFQPVWSPLQTVTLTNGSFFFSEPLGTNIACRFYGLALP